jgi:hypothetical protein
MAVTIDDHWVPYFIFGGSIRRASNHEISKPFNRDTVLPSGKLHRSMFPPQEAPMLDMCRWSHCCGQVPEKDPAVEQEGRRWPTFRD